MKCDNGVKSLAGIILMKHKSIARAGIALVAACVVVASVWFVVPLPARAITVSVSNPSSGNLGESYSFTVTVNVENVDTLPLQSVDLEIRNASDSDYKVTCSDLPRVTGSKQYSTSGGIVSVSATADSTWGSGTTARKATGYAYGVGQTTVDPLSGTFGYGYDFGGSNVGSTSITYTVTWTPPSGWPEGTYEIRLFVNGDGSVQFTTAAFPTFTLEEKAAAAGGFGAPVYPPGVTNLRRVVDSQGVFGQDVTAESADGNVELSIPEDTVGLTADGDPLVQISIFEMEDPPEPPADKKVIGLTYDIGPDGAIFTGDPPVTLSFTYDPDEIPEGVDEEELVIAVWDEDAGEWVELTNISVNPDTNTITGEISHFTAFSVLSPTEPAVEEAPPTPTPPTPAPPTPTPTPPTPAPAPAEFSVSDLTIEPGEAEPGETVTISVSVENTGGTEGTYTLMLTIDGAVEAEKTATVAAGASESVTFSVSKQGATSYIVVVEGLSDIFTVVAPEAPAPPPAEEPGPEAGLAGWIWLIVGLGAAALVGVAIWLGIRRRG
jgi:hypothetical protein